MAIIILILIIISALINFGAIGGWRRVFKFSPVLKTEEERSFLLKNAPLVSIIIPARNEQEVIEECIQALFMQNYPNLEIIVVDDNSTDKTGIILDSLKNKDTRLKVINSSERPPGWAAKNFAVYQGRQKASGDFLLFMDADTKASPELIKQAVSYTLKENVDLLTLMTRPDFQSFWDRLIIPIIGHFIFGILLNANRPDKRGGANGPFLLFRKEAYEAVGGHEGIKNEYLEDQVFGEKIREKSLNLRLLSAPDLIAQKFYKNFQELKEGWVKIFYFNLRRDKANLTHILTPVFIFITFVLPWLIFPVSSIILISAEINSYLVTVISLSFLEILAFLRAHSLMCRFLKINNTIPVLAPFGAILLMYIWLTAYFRVIFKKGATWKNITYTDSEFKSV